MILSGETRLEKLKCLEKRKCLEILADFAETRLEINNDAISEWAPQRLSFIKTGSSKKLERKSLTRRLEITPAEVDSEKGKKLEGFAGRIL